MSLSVHGTGSEPTIVVVVFECIDNGLGVRLMISFRCFLKRVWAALC